MGLDYTDGCVNFRDIGEYINLILEKEVLPEGKLFRGGSIDYIESLVEIGNIKSLINLRNGTDPTGFDIKYYHFPMSNKIEKYNTTLKEVRVWLNSILKVFENELIAFPILIHCLSGKDRTGIVVAALLLILGLEKNVIEEEYLLSEGEVKLELIQESIKGFENIEHYFNRVDLKKIRNNILNS
jgi:protein-tyrosine phosphatase